ncbi:MAG: hypothetical protein L3J24_03200 [Xanthomonadales bacterium]|nr:hypothetical protein [Xanthomonadales bacterium]
MSENLELTINQLEQLLQAQQYTTILELTAQPATRSGWQAIFHALSQAAVGQVETALQQARALLQSDLSPLSGASNETYAQTHVRGKFELVVENMHKIRTALDRYQSDTHVWVGQHTYKHNLDEISQMADLCHTLGFDHNPIPAFYQPLEALIEIAQEKNKPTPVLDLLLEHPSKYIRRFQEHRDKRYDCELRFNQTVINHDGSVALCCSVYNPENQLGVNFLDQSFNAIEKLKYQHSFCTSCYQHGLQYAPSRIHNIN